MDTLFAGGGAVLERPQNLLEMGVLIEEVGHWGWALGCFSPAPLPVLYLPATEAA